MRQAPTEGGAPTAPAAKRSMKAMHSPVAQPDKEYYSDDTPPPALDEVDLDNDALNLSEVDNFEHDLKGLGLIEHAAALAFMEELVTIKLARGTDENAPRFVDLYCNGKAVYIPVETKCRLKRKYLEILLRSQPYSIKADFTMTPDGEAQNRMVRNARRQFSTTILRDTPRGQAWADNVLMAN